MKHIAKMGQPHELRLWFDGQPIVDGRRINCSYDDMPPDVRQIVKQQLIREQGGLCCYTGLYIDATNSHIEHYKSQRQCREEGNHEDVDYNNLFGAYPGENPKNCPFGAHARKDCNHELLINPLRSDCEVRFHFDLSGGIQVANQGDEVAATTIKHLVLDHSQLVALRRQAIESVLFRKNQPITEAQLARIVQSYCQRNSRQMFPNFCFVITQAATNLLEKVRRQRQRKRFSRQQQGQ